MSMARNALITLSVVAMLLTGCVGSKVGPSNEVDLEPVTLRVSWWGTQIRHDATIQVFELYEQQHPNVKIEYEYSSFDEYWKKMAPLASGNALSDIVQMDFSYLSPYASLGLLEDLTSYTENGLIDTQYVSEINLSGGKIGDKLFGISLGVNALSGVYDPEVLEANGVEPPKENWTWADFEAIGKRLKGTGIYLGTGFTPEQFFAYYLRQYGETLYEPDGTRLGYEEDRLFVDFFGMLQRLAREKLIYAPDIFTSNSTNPVVDPFTEGEALFGWGYSNHVIGAVTTHGKPLKIVPMPGPNSDLGLFLKPSMFFSISKNSKQKEEAAKFMSFFINDVEANKLLKGERGMPISSLVIDEISASTSPEFSQISEYIDWVEKHSSPIDTPDPVGAAEVTSVLRELYDLLRFDKLKPEAAAAEFRQKANEILAKNKG